MVVLVSRILNSAGQNRFLRKVLRSCFLAVRVGCRLPMRTIQAGSAQKSLLPPFKETPCIVPEALQVFLLGICSKKMATNGFGESLLVYYLSFSSLLSHPPFLLFLPSSSPVFCVSAGVHAYGPTCAQMWRSEDNFMCLPSSSALFVTGLLFTDAFSKLACSPSIRDSPVSSHLAVEELGL